MGIQPSTERRPTVATTSCRPALHGDEAELFERYAKPLVRVVARAVSVSPDVVDDACSIAWTQLLRTQPRRDCVFAWLRVVACREAIRLHRRELQTVSLDDNAGDVGDAPGSSVLLDGGVDVHAKVELHEALVCIAQLPERRRRTLLLHLAGHKYDGITAQTGDGPKAIDRQIRKARSKLRLSFPEAPLCP
jgi:RNA polymerase sigma factor (sigma-70 family)